MSNLNPLRLAFQSPLNFLKQNPALSCSLLAECNYDLQEVTTTIEPILKAPDRCQVTSLYIQAVAAGRTTFLVTNVVGQPNAQTTSIASSWVLGRSSTCAITVQHHTVSRCHAVIGHHPDEGFYLTDLGSSNGTWVNGQRLIANERQRLKDGDLLQFGLLQVEFFLAAQKRFACEFDETACY